MAGVTVRDAVPVPHGGDEVFLTLLDVEYLEGEPETYVLPLAFAAGASFPSMSQRFLTWWYSVKPSSSLLLPPRWWSTTARGAYQHS